MADNIENNNLFTLKSSLYNPIDSKLKVDDFIFLSLQAVNNGLNVFKRIVGAEIR